MVKVVVLTAPNDSEVGTFEFAVLPRRNEEIIVPWPSDRDGVRIFTVVDINHIAAGAANQWGEGPLVVLRSAEEVG